MTRAASNILYLVHAPGDQESRFADILSERGCSIQFCCHEAGDPLPSATDYDGVVVGGGQVSVWQADQHPFMAREIEFVRRVVDAGVPYLGLCVGCHILAAAYGSTSVPRADGVAEVGFYEIEPTDAGGALFEGLEHVYLLHYEGIETLPDGAELLARSERFGTQAFRLGAAAYGFQFHPDVRADMIEQWWNRYPSYRDLPGAHPLERQLDDAVRFESQRAAWVERFVDSWLPEQRPLLHERRVGVRAG